MIYDCFLFLNELDLLEVRLRELADLVDFFVLVESPITFSGRPKPLYFADARGRLEGFGEKIIHIVSEPSADPDPWKREQQQRDSVMQGLTMCRPDDIILLSDIDEIPRRNTVHSHIYLPGIKTFRQEFFYYWLNCRCVHDWHGTRMAFYRDIVNLRPQGLRHAQGTSIGNGGWHFSYLGGVERIQEKLRSFSHQELNTSAYTDADYIAQSIEKGWDLYRRHDHNFRFIDIDESFPACIRNHQERYSNYIYRKR